METSVRRVRMKPEDRREQILAAATRVFYEKGYDHASTRDLSRAAQTSIAGIYHHFADKELVLFSLLDEAVSRLLALQEEASLTPGTPRQRVEAMVKALVQAVTENRMEVTLLFKEEHRLSPEHRVYIRNKQRQSFNLIRREMAALQGRGDLKDINLTAATFALLGSVNWLYYWHNPGGRMNAEEIAAAFSTIFLDGILKV